MIPLLRWFFGKFIICIIISNRIGTALSSLPSEQRSVHVCLGVRNQFAFWEGEGEDGGGGELSHGRRYELMHS